MQFDLKSHFITTKSQSQNTSLNLDKIWTSILPCLREQNKLDF
jgi:hypothetical protein